MQRFLPLFISIVLLSCSPVSKYRDLPEVIAWENDIRKFEQLDKSESNLMEYFFERRNILPGENFSLSYPDNVIVLHLTNFEKELLIALLRDFEDKDKKMEVKTKKLIRKIDKAFK